MAEDARGELQVHDLADIITAAQVSGIRYGAHTLARWILDRWPPCCDLHGRTCEQGGDECCMRCTETRHFDPGHGGVPCSSPHLSGSGGNATRIALQVVDDLEQLGAKVDVILPDGTHRYWSTHCRHDNHDACSAPSVPLTLLFEGRPLAEPLALPRKPAECKGCGSPCVCPCHQEKADG